MASQRIDDDPGDHDERVHPRVRVREKALICLLSSGRKAECEVLDLSLGGCRLLLLERIPVAPGVQVEGTFRISGTPLRLAGVVRWTDGKDGCGVLFNEMSARCQAILSEIVDELKSRKDEMIREAIEQEGTDVVRE